MVKEKFLLRKHNIFIMFIIVFITVLFLLDYILFLHSISHNFENDFSKALYQRDISYIEKYFDDNCVFQYDNKTLKYKDVKKNILSALNNKAIDYPQNGISIFKFSNRIFFNNERYHINLYVKNPYQGSETGFFIEIKMIGYKEFIITKVEFSEPFWRYFFCGEGTT